ncbi:radical SAM protein [Candidatus Sumerlaeota bacterium]|nr:radical SAM protein [Candidatus Sumerlaeota bacterium]
MASILIVPVGADNPEAPRESPCLLTALVLEAALRGAGIQADVFFYFNEFWPSANKRLLGQITEKQYDIVAVSFMSYNRLEAHDLLRDLAKISPHCRVIVGGIHASFLYEQILREFPNVKAVAIGEGELALVEFCRAPDCLEAIPGIAYRDKAGEVRVTQRAPGSRIDLDRLPALDYELLREYAGPIPIQTCRGCLGHCVFCAWRAMERTIRTKSPARIIEGWAQIRDIFGPHRRIAVFDATYNISPEHVKGMCRALIEAGMTSNPWDVEMRAKPADREVLELMKEAGCKRLLIGVETGNEEIRKNIGKGVSNEDIREMFALAAAIKMPTFPFLITGLPGETDQTVAETIEFVRGLKPFYKPGVAPPQLYPGTVLYEISKKRGLISDEYWLYRHPKNWGDVETCVNMPLFLAERNVLELMRWIYAHNLAVSGPRYVPITQFILNDEEYDCLDPWRVAETTPELQKLFKGRLRGTWKGQARRLVRRIRANLQIWPTRLAAGLPLVGSFAFWVHRLADVYIFLREKKKGSLTFLIWRENEIRTSASPEPFLCDLAAKVQHYQTGSIAPAVGFAQPGRYELCLIVCGAGESVLDRNSWLAWRKRSFQVSRASV